MNDELDSAFDQLIDLPSYSDEELKQLVDSLQTQELEVSRKRRLLHAKLDIVRAETVRRLRDKHRAGESLFGEGDVQKLSSILSSRGLPPEEGE